jgi:hypothetical protein
MKLQEPSPGETDGLSHASQRLTHLEVDVPHQKRQRQVSNRHTEFPKVFRLLLGRPVDEVEGPRPDQLQHGRKHGHMDQEVAASDVQRRHDADGGIYHRRDEAGARGRPPGRVEVLEQRSGEEEHGNVIRELCGLPQGGMEEERTDANQEQRSRHEVEPTAGTGSSSIIPKRKVHWTEKSAFAVCRQSEEGGR